MSASLFDAAGRAPAEDAPPGRTGHRQKLWQIGDGLQCSIVGTCLSHDDLLRIARKFGTSWSCDASTYDVHGYFVKEARNHSKSAVAMQKLLDKRYSATIGRLERCAGDAEREQLWKVELDAGRIAGAYWAFMTDTRVSRALFTRIFGEVHMLSHVHGRLVSQSLSRSSTLQAEKDQLEARTARLSARNRLLAMERDAAIAALAEARAQKDVAARVPSGRIGSRHAAERNEDTRIARRDRALLAARERARGAEQRLLELEEKLARLTLLLETRSVSRAPACPAAQSCDAIVRADVSRRVLYIGGRSRMTDTLRRVATRYQASLVHHDGGLEQSVARIDATIEGCDAVFCPIDCVSHAACLKAKSICKRLQKPFIPLRSSGAATFERALSSLAPG